MAHSDRVRFDSVRWARFAVRVNSQSMGVGRGRPAFKNKICCPLHVVTMWWRALAKCLAPTVRRLPLFFQTARACIPQPPPQLLGGAPMKSTKRNNSMWMQTPPNAQLAFDFRIISWTTRSACAVRLERWWFLPGARSPFGLAPLVQEQNPGVRDEMYHVGDVSPGEGARETEQGKV